MGGTRLKYESWKVRIHTQQASLTLSHYCCFLKDIWILKSSVAWKVLPMLVWYILLISKLWICLKVAHKHQLHHLRLGCTNSCLIFETELAQGNWGCQSGMHWLVILNVCLCWLHSAQVSDHPLYINKACEYSQWKIRSKLPVCYLTKSSSTTTTLKLSVSFNFSMDFVYIAVSGKQFLLFSFPLEVVCVQKCVCVCSGPVQNCFVTWNWSHTGSIVRFSLYQFQKKHSNTNHDK